MEKSNFLIVAIYLITLFFMGGVYSFYWFFIFSLLLIFWGYKKYHTLFKYKIYRDFKINIELPILVFILYSFLIFIPFLQPDYFNKEIIEEFNKLWITLKITSVKKENYQFHYFSTIISILMIISSYLWIKLILLYKKGILKNYKYLFIIYNLVLITSFFNIGIYDIFTTANRNVLGFFINPDHLATFLTLPLPIILYYFFRKNNIKEEKKTRFIIKILYLILILAILTFLNRRMVIISLIITIFLYLIFNFKKLNKIKKIAILLSILILLIISINIFMNRSMDISFLNKDIDKVANLSFRLEAFKIAFEIFKENWLFGIGGGQFPFVYYIFSTNENLFMHHLHNEYLQLLIEYGILGTIIVLWGYFNLIKTIIYGIKKLKKEHKDLFIAHIFAIIIFHIQIFTDFQLHIGALLFMNLFFITMLYIIIYDYLKHIKKDNAQKNI